MRTRPRHWPARHHPSGWAFLVHRLSGLALAAFLPAHFWVLGLAIEGEAALDGFLRWTEHPLLKASEVVLVLLLAAHLTGGLRVLALELLPVSARARTLVAIAAGGAVAIGAAFALGLG